MDVRFPASGFEVAIVGGGPVGLLLAVLLGGRGLQVAVIERELDLPEHSRAIGITPPSLEILAQAGLEETFKRRGIWIRECHVHGQAGYLGLASFREIPGRNRFVLSLPQRETLCLLHEKLATLPSVRIFRGASLSLLVQDGSSITLQWRTGGGGAHVPISASWLVGCDGCRSGIREWLRLRSSGGRYGCHFAMGDFVDRSPLGAEAHLFFTAEGAVESFPLPGGQRRWIVQTAEHQGCTPPGLVAGVVQRRTGQRLSVADQVNQSAFTPRWMQCERYVQGRGILCGDAAHLMSPIGGQGMNTGWADAEFAAVMLTAILRNGEPAEPWLRAYDHCRRAASWAAIRRAARGMWLGTRTGPVPAWWRDLVIRCCLGPVFARKLSRDFAMMTIPYNTVANIPWRRFGLERETNVRC